MSFKVNSKTIQQSKIVNHQSLIMCNFVQTFNIEFLSLEPKIEHLLKLAKDKHKETKSYFDKLKKKPPKQLDYIMLELHEAEFKKTDCLTCANCCKTTGPLFTDKDIERIAKHFKMKSAQFIAQFLRLD